MSGIYGVRKNKCLQPIGEYLVAFLNDTENNKTIVETNVEQKINLNASTIQEGNGLSIVDGNIVIGKGVTRIKFSANVWIQAATEGTITMCITKNDTYYSRSTMYKAFDYNTLNASERIINVEEGDIISLKVIAPKNSIVSATNNLSYLTVEVMNRSN